MVKEWKIKIYSNQLNYGGMTAWMGGYLVSLHDIVNFYVFAGAKWLDYFSLLECVVFVFDGGERCDDVGIGLLSGVNGVSLLLLQFFFAWETQPKLIWW